MHIRSCRSSARNIPFHSEIQTRVFQGPSVVLQCLLNLTLLQNSLIASHPFPFPSVHQASMASLLLLNRTGKVLPQGLCISPRMLFLQRTTRLDALWLWCYLLRFSDRSSPFLKERKGKKEREKKEGRKENKKGEERKEEVGEIPTPTAQNSSPASSCHSELSLPTAASSGLPAQSEQLGPPAMNAGACKPTGDTDTHRRQSRGYLAPGCSSGGCG